MNQFIDFTQAGAELDARDPLASFRQQFAIPKGTTYLVGHSLGLQCDSARDVANEAFNQWAALGVESWFDEQPQSALGPWLELEKKSAQLLAPFLGANPSDVTVTGALGSNLQLLLHTFFRPQGERREIAVMRSMFPQDRWLVTNHLLLPGNETGTLRWLDPRQGERLMRDDDLVSLLEKEGQKIGILLLEAVSYVTGQFFDLGRIARAARRAGVIFIVDLAHAAFVCPLTLNAWDVDAAVGCSYKFGCSGPGGVGLLYINERHWSNPKTWRPGGWWGNDRATQFLMGPQFQAAQGASGWQVSTLSVLAAASFYGALKVFAAAKAELIWEKRQSLMTFLVEALKRVPDSAKFDILTPTDPARRGSEVALEFINRDLARSLKEWLRTKGVLVDYRESPFDSTRGIIRAGVHPLFNTHLDVSHFVTLLAQGLKDRS